jgi:hypothetical protein
MPPPLDHLRLQFIGFPVNVGFQFIGLPEGSPTEQ